VATQANPLTNTYIPVGPGQASLEFEELRDEIEELTPTETPFYSNARKGTIRSLQPEWGTVNLDPNGTLAPAVAEKRGFEATMMPAVVPERLANAAELVAETGSVADSYDAIDLAGREDESDWQALLKGQLVRLKLDKLLFANQAATYVEPYTMATFPAWVGGERFQSVATTPGTPATGDGTDVYVPGTGVGAFDSIDPVDDVMEACYKTNGQPKVMYMHPSIARQWSKIPDASVAENRVNVTLGTPKEFAFYGSVGLYLSDFGLLERIIERQADPSYMAMVDPEYFEIATLPGRAFKKTPLAKTGSSTKFMIEWEGTTRVWNPTAHGMVEFGVASPPPPPGP